MALQLKGRVCEGCEAVTYMDTTGPYDATDNPTGYGIANGVTSPSSFTTYVLSVWFPGTAITDTPDYTLNLKAQVPPPDTDGFYSWVITKDMLGVEAITSGVYTFKAAGVIGLVTYPVYVQKILINDLKDHMKDLMKDYDPDCGCSGNCEDASLLYSQYLTVACGGICDGAAAQSIIDDLYKQESCC